MVKKLIAQTNFTAGELTPRLYSRVDFQKYGNGCETIENAHVTAHGPLVRRGGLEYIEIDDNSNNQIRLIKFQFSSSEAYMLEFGNNYIRVFKDKALVSPITKITTTYTTAQCLELAYAQFGNDLYIAHPSHPPRVLTRSSDTSWAIADLDLSPPPTYVNGEAGTVSLTPGATAGIGINFTAGSAFFQQADVGRQIINESGAGRASIVSFTSTTVVVCDIVEDFPSTAAITSGNWKLDESPIETLTPSGSVSGSVITLTASTLNTFRTSDVGRYIKIHNGVVKIISRTSATVVRCEVLKSLDAVTATSVWTLEDESWSLTRGYPIAVGFYSQRLVFGGTTAQPQTIWMSETGIFDGFGTGTDDDAAISLDLSSSQANSIQWLAAARDLVVGTTGGELTISPSSGSAVTPTSLQLIPRTYYGSLRQTPLVIGNEIIFVQQSKRKIRSFRYDFNIDGYTGDDLTFLAEHIATGDIIEIAYAQEPNSLIYAVMDNGDMIVGAYNRDQQVIGWSTYNTQGDFEAIQTLSVGSTDQVWTSVKRIDSAGLPDYVRIIEVLSDGTGENSLDSFQDSFFTQSATSFNIDYIESDTFDDVFRVYLKSTMVYSTGRPVKIESMNTLDTDLISDEEIEWASLLNNRTFKAEKVSTTEFILRDLNNERLTPSSLDPDNSLSTYFADGSFGGVVYRLENDFPLSHLDAYSTQIRTDGSNHPILGPGETTLQRYAKDIVVGLQYTTTVKTLRPTYDIGLGEMQGQRVRRVQPILRVYKSAKPLLNGEYLPSRTFADNTNESVPLITGDLYYEALGWDNTGQFTVTMSDPFPLQLQGVFGSIDAGVK